MVGKWWVNGGLMVDKWWHPIYFLGLCACKIWLKIQNYSRFMPSRENPDGLVVSKPGWISLVGIFHNTDGASAMMMPGLDVLWELCSLGRFHGPADLFLAWGQGWEITEQWRIGMEKGGTQNFWAPDRPRITCFNIQKWFEYYQVEECMYLNHGQCRTLVLVSFLTSLQGPIAKSSYFLGCVLRWLRILMPTHRFWHLYSPIFEASTLLVCLMVVKQ